MAGVLYRGSRRLLYGLSRGQLTREAPQARILASLLTPHLTLPAVSQSRGLRDDLKEKFDITWREPERMKSFMRGRTGDLEPFDQPDKTEPLLSMRLIQDEYDEADPVTQQLLSLEFAPNRQALLIVQYDTLRRVQRHQYDTTSLQARIGLLTCSIRYMQTDAYAEKLKRNWLRCFLNEKVLRRRKYLNKLRNIDYKLFEWLLHELDIMHRPYPKGTGKLYRFDSLRKLVRLRSEGIRKERFAAYKAKLEAQQPAFLDEKYETLQWIKETEEKLGLEVTVDPEKGVIDPPVVVRPTIFQRVFGPYLDD